MFLWDFLISVFSSIFMIIRWIGRQFPAIFVPCKGRNSESFWGFASVPTCGIYSAPKIPSCDGQALVLKNSRSSPDWALTFKRCKLLAFHVKAYNGVMNYFVNISNTWQEVVIFSDIELGGYRSSCYSDVLNYQF